MLDATCLPRGSAVTCKHCGYTLAMYSTVFKSQFTYLPRQRSGERVRLGIQRLLVRAHGAPLFFFQQCSPVGIDIFTGEDSQ